MHAMAWKICQSFASRLFFVVVSGNRKLPAIVAIVAITAITATRVQVVNLPCGLPDESCLSAK